MKSPTGKGAGRFIGKISDGGRKRDKLNAKQGTTFVFGQRCESARLQEAINQRAVKSNGNFDFDKYTNPDWRNEDRSKWVSPKNFIVKTSQSSTPRMQKK